MDKPDFGLGQGRLYNIKWTGERRAYLAHCAQAGMSAAEFAEHIGLDRSRGPRIGIAARRMGIQLAGRPGRPVGTVAHSAVVISKAHHAVLCSMAKVRGVRPKDVLSDLIAGAFEQGSTFLENLLDEE